MHIFLLLCSALSKCCPTAALLLFVVAVALQAVIDRYGAWEVDDAPPVIVEVNEVVGSSGQGSSSTAGSSGAGGSQEGGGKVGGVSIKITGA